MPEALYKCLNETCPQVGQVFKAPTLASAKHLLKDFPRCPSCKRYACLVRTLREGEA